MTTRLTNERRDQLLELLSFDHGHVEEPGERAPIAHFPIKEHLRALEPEVVFVLGPRGSGKSSLVSSISSPERRSALAKFADVRLPRDGGVWLRGHPYGMVGPSPRAWETFAADNDSGALQILWLSVLARSLTDELEPVEQAQLAPILKAEGSDPVHLYDAARERAAVIERTFDALETRLRARDRALFVMYDELDTLFHTQWSAMMKVIQALMAMWGGYYRRWKFIRAKFFLRSDLFEESAQLSTSDVAKMAARRVDLHWGPRELYGALFQHIIHRDTALADYFARSLPTREHSGLGIMPAITRTADAEPAVQRLCGEHMGANSNKGHTVTWLPRSVSDGAGQVSPRNLVTLIEKAALLERQNPRARKHAQLIHHVSLRNALTSVSEEHVRESMKSEYPWLHGLRERLTVNVRTREVPWERRQLQRHLEQRWDEPWSTGTERTRPPALDAAEFIDRLLRLGILRERKLRSRALGKPSPEIGIDAPDLYLDGLNLVRRGGVARQ